MSPIIIFALILALLCFLNGILIPRLAVGNRGNNFGVGMGISGITFLIWAYALTLPTVEGLYNFINVGLAFLLIAMLFFLRAGTQHVSASTRRGALIFATLYIFALLIVRSYFPSNPALENSGVFLFNPHPYVKIMEVILFVSVLAVATLTVYDEIRVKDRLSSDVFYMSMTIIRVAVVVLIITTENLVVLMAGIAIGLALIFLLLTSLGTFRLAFARNLIYMPYNTFHRYAAPALTRIKK